MDEPAQKRGRGRPPKLKRCARCAQEKRRRDYDNGRDDVCSFCKHEIRSAGGPRGVQGVDLANTGQDGVPSYVPMKPAVREPIMEAIKLDAMTEALSAVFKPMPRCECCYEYRHVARDSYGGSAVACARCSYQICATGACHLHHSRVYYPELAAEHETRMKALHPVWTGALAVPSPPEVEQLFYVPESTAPKYTAEELAEAD